MRIEKRFTPVIITFESKEGVEMLRVMVGLCKETTKVRIEMNFREMLQLIEKSL